MKKLWWSVKSCQVKVGWCSSPNRKLTGEGQLVGKKRECGEWEILSFLLN